MVVGPRLVGQGHRDIWVVDVLDSGMADWLGTSRRHGRSSSSTSSKKADRRLPNSAVGPQAVVIACVVFSEVAEGSVGNGHKGEVTEAICH